MSNTELAWAAGFFDGEGTSLTVYNRVPGKYASTRVQFKTTDARLADRFHRAVGLGTVYGPHDEGRYQGAKRRSSFVYVTTNFEDSSAVMALLWPYLGAAKRLQWRQALAKRKTFSHERTKARRKRKETDGG